MNDEQFEAVMVDTAVTLALCELGAKEDKRKYDFDVHGNLICYIWATKPIEEIHVDFTICKNVEGEYHANFES